LSRLYIFNYIFYISLIIFLLNPLFLGSNEIEHVNSIIITLEGKELENGAKISAFFKITIVTDLITEKIDWKDLTLSNYTIQGDISITFKERPLSGQYWTYSNNYYLILENNKTYNFILFINDKEIANFNFNASLQTYETPYVYIYTTIAGNNTITKTKIIETRTTLSIKEMTIFSTIYITNTTTTTSITPISPTTKIEITTHTITSLAKDTYIKNGYIIILMTFLVVFLIVFAFLIRLYKKRRIKVIKLDESELEYL
jgi:hypothetical protein